MELHDRFRVIYCATQRMCALAEVTARFRTRLPIIAAHTQLGDVSIEESGQPVIPAQWRQQRWIGSTVVDPSLRFVDIVAAASLQHLRHTLAPLALLYQLSDIDISALTSQHRLFT